MKKGIAVVVLVMCCVVMGAPSGNQEQNIDQQQEHESEFKPTGYIEYLTSTGLNVILAAPHGGTEAPPEIPDRDAGCWDGNACVWSHTCGTKDPTRCAATVGIDVNTAELLREVRMAMCTRFNRCPAGIVNLLHRSKLDANREVNEATFGVPLATEAYSEFQRYITVERGNIRGRGLFIDIHGHGHALQVAELGYLLTADELNNPASPDPSTTSIRNLAQHVGGDFNDLLRGPRSFGAFLNAEGFPSVPSPSMSGPGSNPYFTGGYNTRTHGSLNGGEIDAIQIESPSSFRDQPTRDQYVQAIVSAVGNYLAANYN